MVVDTGMHYKGWSREEAVNLFIENSAKSILDINNEVDRYIAWPGQALAYKIGQLKILELRNKAEKLLGDKYDIKDFHYEVLKRGSLPLDLLEFYIDEWINLTLASQTFYIFHYNKLRLTNFFSTSFSKKMVCCKLGTLFFLM